MIVFALSSLALGNTVVVGPSSTTQLQEKFTAILEDLAVGKELEVVSVNAITQILEEDRSLNKKCQKENCIAELGRTLEANQIVEILHEQKRNVDILQLNLYSLAEKNNSDPILIRQKSCSTGSKDNLYENCKGTFLQLIDGTMGLRNLLHPYSIKGPEPIRSCLQHHLPPAETSRSLELIIETKEASTSLYRPTASGSAELLMDGKRLSYISWTTDAPTIEGALKNAQDLNNLHQDLNANKICIHLAEAFKYQGKKDYGE